MGIWAPPDSDIPQDELVQPSSSDIASWHCQVSGIFGFEDVCLEFADFGIKEPSTRKPFSSALLRLRACARFEVSGVVWAAKFWRKVDPYTRDPNSEQPLQPTR